MSLSIKLKGGSRTTVSGTLSGSSTLAIPQGCALVSLTGRGGIGGDNSWDDPGQPYIAPTYVNNWQCVDYYEGVLRSDGQTYTNATQLSTGTGPTPASYLKASGSDATWEWWNEYILYESTGETMTNPGQPYIAPTSGGGPTTGASTTATLNGSTDTWVGGTGSGVNGTTSTQTLASTGAGQTMSYSIASGGTLSYSYEY